MEWLARELSLVDLAIVVDGAPVDVVRWIANLDHQELSRVFLTYQPETLTDHRATELEISRYDAVYSTSTPQAAIDWLPIGFSIAPQDSRSIPAEYLPVLQPDRVMSPDEAARSLESALRIDGRRSSEI